MSLNYFLGKKNSTIGNFGYKMNNLEIIIHKWIINRYIKKKLVLPLRSMLLALEESLEMCGGGFWLSK